jgi:hypothetical protein
VYLLDFIYIARWYTVHTTLFQMLSPPVGNVNMVGPKLGWDIYSLQNEFTSSLLANIYQITLKAFVATPFPKHHSSTILLLHYKRIVSQVYGTDLRVCCNYRSNETSLCTLWFQNASFSNCGLLENRSSTSTSVSSSTGRLLSWGVPH